MRKIVSVILIMTMLSTFFPTMIFAQNSNDFQEIIEKNGNKGFEANGNFYYLNDGKIICEANGEATELLNQYEPLKLQKTDTAVVAIVQSQDGEVLRLTLTEFDSTEIGFSLFSTTSNEETIYNFVTNEMGVNNAAACGILANIYKESSFRPTASCIDSNGLTSYGICQWNGSRFTDLKNYCAKKGYNYASITGQLYFLKYELEGSESSAYSKIKNVENSSSGAYTAGYNWARYFERCASSYYESRAILAQNTYWPRYGANANAYNVDKALSYARDHWDDGVGLCADFVSACLTAGGISVKKSTTRDLRDYLVNKGYAESNLITKTQGIRIKMDEYPGKIAVGDVIINYCPTCNVYPHVMFVSGKNSSGYVTYYAHNSAANNKAYYNGSTGYPRHSGHSFHMYVLHMKNSIHGGTTVEQPKHTHSYSVRTESEHPHKKYNVCDCGAEEYIGTSTQTNCAECYPLGSIKFTQSYKKTKGTATFNRNNVINANGYTLNLYYKSSLNGSYSLYDSYSMTETSKNVSSLKSGYYYATLNVKNSNTNEEKTKTGDTFRIVDTYNVSFNANGGTNAPSSQTKIQDTDLTLTTSKPTREHYIFKGWATSKNAITAKYQPGGTYTKNAKITLYAVWEPETYNVKFDINGGKGELQDVTITYGNTLKMPNTIVKEYAYLKGWSTDKNAQNVEYNLSDDYKIDRNLTLYAVWGNATWNNEVSESIEGKGTQEEPYLISSAADLAYLANKVNTNTSAPTYEYYKLTDNINLTYTEWVPIGVYSNENQYFYGSFDANGYTISDLNITNANQGYIGLFGYAKDSEFKNLTLTGAIESLSSTGEVCVGGLVGYCRNTMLNNISSKYFNIGSIAAGTSNSSSVGTVAGKTDDGNIANCVSYDSSINVKSGRFAIGMIAGTCNSDISDCLVESTSGGLFSTASTVDTFTMGGLCGVISKTAEKCSVKAPYFSNNIKTTSNASSVTCMGGLTGALTGVAKICSVQFTDSAENSITSTGTGTSRIGGFVGNAGENAKIVDCKFDGKSISGTTTSGYTYVGGLVGYALPKTNPTVTVNGGQSLSYVSLPKKDGYKATWYTDSSYTTPYDFSQTVTSDMTLYAKWEEGDSSPDIWDGTSKEPAYNAETKTYTITNGEELAWVSDVVGGKIIEGTNMPADESFSGYIIKLADDIYLNDISNCKNWSSTPPDNIWIPIGGHDLVSKSIYDFQESSSTVFSGTFDGNNYKIYGLYINNEDFYYVGLFGNVSNADIHNITIMNGYVYGRAYVGGITGYSDGSEIYNCTNYIPISNDYRDAGGIAGYAKGNSYIYYCYNYGNVYNDYSSGGGGGIVGTYEGTSYIERCQNYGYISGLNLGGIVGVFSGNDIERCSNYGLVSATDGPTGGICGLFIGNGGQEIRYCYNEGDITGPGLVGGITGRADYQADIKYCYNTGDITGTGTKPKVGGIVGWHVSYDYDNVVGGEVGGSIQFCYNRDTVDGGTNGYSGGIVGFADCTYIYQCYSKASVYGSSDWTGGIAGIARSNWNDDEAVELVYCYANKEPLYNINSTTQNGGRYSIRSVSYLSSSSLKTLSNLVGFSTSKWGINLSYNSGYPYLKTLESSYSDDTLKYTITAVVEEDKTLINRAFSKVDGDLTGSANQSSFVGGIIGYSGGNSNSSITENKNMVGEADNISSSTTVSSYKGYSGNIIGLNSNSKFSFENAYYNTAMNVTSSTNTIDTTGTAKSLKTMNVGFFTNVLGLTAYSSLDNLNTDANAVWVLKDGKLPELYYNCLNDITVSKDIENGTVTTDKTQAVEGEKVTVVAKPDENYVLNKIYVNGEEIEGISFEMSGESEIFVTFAEKIPEYKVTVEETENAEATLVNADIAGGVSLMSASDNITAADGEEILVNTQTSEDYTISAIYINGEELGGDSFILEANTVVTMSVENISTNYSATTNDAENVGSYSATLGGSVEDFEGASRYIRYWKTDDAENVFVTEVLDGSGECSFEVTGLDANTQYSFQMNENGEIKTFTTVEETAPVTEDGSGVVINVTGVTLDKTTASINVGETLSLTANVTPDNATNTDVIWGSSDTSIATVSNGVVTAVAEGEVTITVLTADAEFAATCEVTVNEKVEEGLLDSGTDANGIKWSIYENGILIIKGSGAMEDYSATSSIPWYDERGNIKEIIIEQGITHIGNRSFYNFISAEKVTIPESVTSIGTYAFRNCDEMTIYGENGTYAQTYATENNIPFVNTKVEKLETVTVEMTANSSKWYFDVSVEGYTGQARAYAAIYDDKGKLLTITSEELIIGDLTTLYLDKSGNSTVAYAKIFVWNSILKPVALSKTLDL